MHIDMHSDRESGEFQTVFVGCSRWNMEVHHAARLDSTRRHDSTDASALRPSGFSLLCNLA